MPRFRIRLTSADTNDLAEYDRLAAVVKRAGFHAMGCGSLAELTQDQMADPEDSWVRFTAMNTGITKFVETSVVHDVISKSHIEKNAALITEKSKILARHGLKGVFHALEPQWLPESFYAKYPDLRGARCDHPGVARSRYYAPCLDRPEILAHYREGLRKLLEMAPELGYYSIWTNDSGGGICWCSGLYPGKNGPDFCRKIPFARRIRRWLEAVLAGAADAGKDIEALIIPVHFSPDETYSTLARLPRRARFIVEGGIFPNEPFSGDHAQKLIAESKARRRGAILSIDPTLGYPLGPLTETPIPYFILDKMREAFQSGADGILTGGLRAPIQGIEAVSTAAISRALAKPPKTHGDVEKQVLQIARDQVGTAFAAALADAWRDVDYAFRIWPLSNDPEHMLYTFYTVMGFRWLVRPLVPVPERVTPEEKAYFDKHRHGGRDPRFENDFFVSESRYVYGLDEYKWVVGLYNVMMRYFARALASLEAPLAASAHTPAAATLARHYRRIAILRALWRTHRNFYQSGSIIEYMKSDRRAEFEKHMPTWKRIFLEGVDDEIANCREMIKLLRESDVPLIATGDVESSFVLPHNLPEQLETKISLMQKYRGDVALLFPNCPEEELKDETYEETDQKLTAEGV